MRSATQRWWLGLVVAAALIAVLAELRAQTAPSEDALVLEADKALGAALRGDDKSVARRLLSLQFTFVDANGKIHERKDFLTDLKAAAAAPPSDPVVKARVDAINNDGGNAFYDYQVPAAVITLKQGFGRLIRSLNDRGVLALLGLVMGPLGWLLFLPVGIFVAAAVRF